MLPSVAQAPTFQEAECRLNALRQSLRALLSSVPGGSNVRTGMDIERLLGVHRKLAWQIQKLLQAGNCVADARFLPSRVQYERFIETAVTNGGSREVGDVAAARFDELEVFIRDACGSRAGFESMISDSDREAAMDIAFRHREAMYEAASHLYGICAETRFCCNIVAPSAGSETHLDYIHIDGQIGLRRQRGVGQWPVTRFDGRFRADDGTWRSSDEHEMLDEEGFRKHGVSVIREFSADPIPTLEHIKSLDTAGGQVLAHFEDIGNPGAMNLVFGVAMRRADTRDSERSPLGQWADLVVGVETPCRTLISDALIHQSIEIQPSEIVTLRFDVEQSGSIVAQTDTNRLPIEETVSHAGWGTTLIARTQEIPGYERMLERCLARCDRPANEFRAYRSVISYPLVSTLVSMRLV